MKTRRPIGPWLVATLLMVACGCTKEDHERLTHVGGRVGTRVDALFSGPRDKLGDGWQGLMAGWEQVSLDARVSARLRWDKALETAAIQVHAEGDTVQLKGTVRDLDQRRRAVELAGSTAGVRQVIDELQTPVAGP